MSQKDPNSRTIYSEAKLITLAVLGYNIIHRLLKIFNGQLKMILHLKVRSIKKHITNMIMSASIAVGAKVELQSASIMK